MEKAIVDHQPIKFCVYVILAAVFIVAWALEFAGTFLCFPARALDVWAKIKPHP
jgi:hypothetical protein